MTTPEFTVVVVVKPWVWVAYPTQRNIPRYNPGFQVDLLGIPPSIKNIIEAIKYLIKTIDTGEKTFSKIFTIIKVEPKNNEDKNNADKCFVLSLFSILVNFNIRYKILMWYQTSN